MDKFYGFDLGDAESAVALLEKEEDNIPGLLEIGGEKSFISAYAALPDGQLLIGEKACYHADAVRRRIRFKSRFLTEKSCDADIIAFAGGVLGELLLSGGLSRSDECCFYVGCPAGWDKQSRERYRALFERTGFPPTRIISESRAALVSACQSKHLQVGYDILSRPVLVADIGSSTTDFAYIWNGHEVGICADPVRPSGRYSPGYPGPEEERLVRTGGEIALGGGQLDEMLLELSVASSENEKQIREIFTKSEPWKNYCEFAARRLKERYFSEEEYWKEHDCTESILIRYDRPVLLVLRMNEQIAHRLLYSPSPVTGDRSFYDVFTTSLKQVRSQIQGEEPELLFLTGGVSKMPSVGEWCREVFTDTIVITGTEPEFAVARGLAWSGRIDERLRRFRADLEALKASRTVEDIVEKHIPQLYRSIVDALTDPILKNAAQPVLERWRSGEMKRLEDTNEEMRREIAAYLKSPQAREQMIRPVSAWLRPVAEELEEFTVPLCIRHGVPYTALSLKTGLTLTDLEVSIDARNVFAVEEITWMIDSIITVLVSLLCGGSGVALISSGPAGIAAGAAISALVLVLGKERMEDALLKADVPKPLRRLVSRKSLENRMDSVSASLRANLYDSLENDKNEEIQQRMTDEISLQIEECLTRMAQVVEVPLG